MWLFLLGKKSIMASLPLENFKVAIWNGKPNEKKNRRIVLRKRFGLPSRSDFPGYGSLEINFSPNIRAERNP